MYYLIIDTCVWIDLCKEFPKVSAKLTDLVERGKVRLLLPQIVIDEWNRNKESKIVAAKLQGIRTRRKHAKELLPLVLEDDAEEFARIVGQIQEREPEIGNQIQRDTEAIESLFDHASTIKPPITQDVESRAVEFALEKKAPFKSKNSMADALILFSCVEYVENRGLDNCIFVSSNKRDFSSNDPSQIHEDLKPVLDGAGVAYFINIGKAVNEIESNLIADEEIRQIEQTWQREAIQRVLEDYRQIMQTSMLMTEALVFNQAETMDRIDEMIEPASQQTQETMDRINEMVGPVSQQMQETMDRINAMIEPASPQIQETMGRINEMVGPVSQQMQETMNRINEMVGPVSQQMQETTNTINEMMAPVNQEMRETRKRINEMMKPVIKAAVINYEIIRPTLKASGKNDVPADQEAEAGEETTECSDDQDDDNGGEE